MNVEWSELFGLSVSPLELIVRGSALYLFLLLLFRVVIKRRIGSIGMTDGFILISTIIAWNYAFDWAMFRFPRLQKLLEPPPLLLIDGGRVLWRRPTSRPTARSA
jgi:uncharacterized membrane protein YcaP (DUF421 family)